MTAAWTASSGTSKPPGWRVRMPRSHTASSSADLTMTIAYFMRPDSLQMRGEPRGPRLQVGLASAAGGPRRSGDRHGAHVRGACDVDGRHGRGPRGGLARRRARTYGAHVDA